MNALLLAGLLSLHPMQEAGHMEVSSQPRMGVRSSITMTGTEFGASFGVESSEKRTTFSAYGSLWGRLEMPQYDGATMRVEAEHRYFPVEQRRWRMTLKAARRFPIWYTMEYQYGDRILWGQPNRYGQVQVGRTRVHAQYLTWEDGRVLARLGVGERAVGLTVSARF